MCVCMYKSVCVWWREFGGGGPRLRVQADKAFLRGHYCHQWLQKKGGKKFRGETDVENNGLIICIHEQYENKHSVYVPYQCSHLTK